MSAFRGHVCKLSVYALESECPCSQLFVGLLRGLRLGSLLGSFQPDPASDDPALGNVARPVLFASNAVTLR